MTDEEDSKETRAREPDGSAAEGADGGPPKAGTEPEAKPEAKPETEAEAKPEAKPKPKPKKAKKTKETGPDLAAPVRQALLKSSPHKTDTDSTPRIMYTVVVALIPACVAACWFFGVKAAAILVGTVAGCVGLEYALLLLRMPSSRAWRTALDGSAIVTGILLALNLPSSSPWWLVAVGCLVAIGLGKQTFGGLGQNPFNPALVARVFLLLSFPAHMTSWEIPVDRFLQLDALTGATPLGIVSTEGAAGLAAYVSETGQSWAQYLLNLFVGNTGGSLGEVSVAALLLGAAYMLVRRVITWHIPVTYVATTFLLCAVMWLIDPDTYANPVFHVVSGGLILGAFYMATDMVSTPVTARGMLIFGAGCGLLTAVIRLFGAFPEGVSFAILIMNALVPLIERRTKPRKFGEVRTRKEARAHA